MAVESDVLFLILFGHVARTAVRSGESHKVGTLSDQLERDSSGPFGGCARTAVCSGALHKVGTLSDKLESFAAWRPQRSVRRKPACRFWGTR